MAAKLVVAALAHAATAQPSDPCAGSPPGRCRVVCEDLPGAPCTTFWQTSYQVARGLQKIPQATRDACCALGGGRVSAVRAGPPVDREVNVSRWAAHWVPNACVPHAVQEFPTIASLLSDGKDATMGDKGGQWSACTHLKVYGINMAIYLARALAFRLQPRSVLEFGCGLGTTADFLARFTPGGSRVICVEPEPMLAEVFNRNPPPRRALQLAFNAFAPGGAACFKKLFQRPRFDLVLSLEVAEHLAPQQIDPLVDALAGATKKYLVFAAARPGQKGTGHVEGSMKSRHWWIAKFESRGLVHLPELSKRLREAAHPERPYDLGLNTFAMGRPPVGVDRSDASHFDGLDCEVTPHLKCQYPIYKLPGTHPDFKDGPTARAYREAKVRGMVQGLWPELDMMISNLKRKPGPSQIHCL